MTESTTANRPGFEQQAAAKWLHKRTRPLFAGLAVALHNGEVKRIDETRLASSLAVLSCPLGTTGRETKRGVREAQEN
jgi:hypothetical protein